MWHVCESLSLDELEEAFNSQATNVGIVKIIKICHKLAPRGDNGLLKDCDLLIF